MWVYCGPADRDGQEGRNPVEQCSRSRSGCQREPCDISVTIAIPLISRCDLTVAYYICNTKSSTQQGGSKRNGDSCKENKGTDQRPFVW